MNELTDQEIDKLITFKEDEVMFEAVRKVLLAAIYSNGTLRKGLPSNPLLNAALSLVSSADKDTTNERLGEDLRALWEGVKALETGLEHIKEYQRKNVLEQLADNPAV